LWTSVRVWYDIIFSFQWINDTYNAFRSWRLSEVWWLLHKTLTTSQSMLMDSEWNLRHVRWFYLYLRVIAVVIFLFKWVFFGCFPHKMMFMSANDSRRVPNAECWGPELMTHGFDPLSGFPRFWLDLILWSLALMPTIPYSRCIVLTFPWSYG